MSEATNTVTPLATSKQFDDSDVLVYLPEAIQKIVDTTFPLSEYDNPSDYMREFLSDGATLAAKYICQSSINRWESVLNKAMRMSKYNGLSLEDVGKELVKRSEFRKIQETAVKAKGIKAKL
jgi:chaperonin GroEL (HSP60 family)